jgi:hypothetical protein
MKTTVAFLLSLAICSVALIADAGAQSSETCRTRCGYVANPTSPNEGKASQTPQVNACYRKCMKRAPASKR